MLLLGDSVQRPRVRDEKGRTYQYARVYEDGESLTLFLAKAVLDFGFLGLYGIRSLLASGRASLGLPAEI